jgi:tetrapyrrole methylase family protein/MazG family protein
LRAPFDPALAVLLIPDSDTLDSSAPGTRATGDFQPDVLPGRALRHDPAGVLSALYPADHAVLGLGGIPDRRIDGLTSPMLAAGGHFIPPLDEQANVASPHGLPWLVARLRAPDGCPWDREQTHTSLRKFLLEESYEVYDALEAGSTPELAGELGDLLLQVVLHAHYAAEDGVFDLSDVYKAVMLKIIRRHPHVFGDVDARTVDDVLRNWERIKAAERAGAAESAATKAPARMAEGDTRDEISANGRNPGAMPEAFRGLSRSLPALSYSQEIQERAASLGYDWPAIEPVIEKLDEELAELRAAETPEQRQEEFGDLLLVIVNLGRKLGIDTEAALRSANAKFARRFAEVERLAAAREVRLNELSFEELDELWQAAKQAGAP